MRLFRRIWIAFLLLELLLFFLPLSLPLHLTGGVLLLIVFMATLAWGAATLSSGMFIHAKCKGEPRSKRIALTFDDGPHPDATPKIMKLLEERGITATFFLRGDQLSDQAELVRELHRRGHLLGNHSYSHSSLFPLLSSTRIAEEISTTSRRLEEITGEAVCYFRPPFGVSNPRIARGLKNSGLQTIGWSIRSFDTRNEDPAKVIQRIEGKLQGGSILLFHDQAEHILEILELLLPLISERQLSCVNLDSL